MQEVTHREERNNLALKSHEAKFIGNLNNDITNIQRIHYDFGSTEDNIDLFLCILAKHNYKILENYKWFERQPEELSGGEKKGKLVGDLKWKNSTAAEYLVLLPISPLLQPNRSPPRPCTSN